MDHMKMWQYPSTWNYPDIGNAPVVNNKELDISEISEQFKQLESAARAVIDEIRRERICCNDCAVAGKEAYFTPAEQELIKVLEQNISWKFS